MTHRRAMCVLLSLVFAVILQTSATAAELTGTWSGNATLSFVCDYHDTSNHIVSVPVSGNIGVSMSALQSGSSVNGSIVLTNIPDADQLCRVTGTIPALTGPFSGSGSGGSFELTALIPSDKGMEAIGIGATLDGSGNSLGLTAASSGGGNATVSGSLSRTSSTAPDSSLSGTWTGTAQETFIPCGKLAPITQTETITLSMVQSGPSLFGSGLLSNSKRDDDSSGTCVVTDAGPLAFSLLAEVNGSNVQGYMIAAADDAVSFEATLSGTTMTGSVHSSEERPGESITFTLSRTGTSTPPPPPTVSGFTATPPSINAGQSSSLSWATSNTTSVSIDHGVGSFGASGAVSVSPKETTTYTLTAIGAGAATASTTVTVNAGAPANVVVSSFPSGMLQLQGGENATDAFSLTNSGSSDASVTLTTSGNFFSIAPVSFTLAAGSTQPVSIRSTQQNAGSYEGTINVSSGSAAEVRVPVRLLVSGAPAGSVVPQPSASRVDVSAPAGQNPSGSITFSNSGTAALQAIAVSDSPWLIPQSGAINIAPGQSQAVSFTIDRSKRPDSAAPVGGSIGRISLLYFGSSVATPSSHLVSNGTTPAPSTVSVVVVDVVPPGVTPGAPPALNPGELALFIQGLRNDAHAAGDVLFSSRSSAASAVSDLKIYSQASQSSAAVSSFPANVGVAFPAILKNVFGLSGGGTLQFRGGDIANLAVAGIVNSSSPDGLRTFATSFPVLRSTGGMAPGEKLVLSGIERIDDAADPVTSTLVIHEVSGNAGNVHVEYRDAAGSLVGSTDSAVARFAVVTDAVPAGVQSAVVSNTSSGTSRLCAYVSRVNGATGDGWVMTSTASTSDGLILPLVGTGEEEVFVTNMSASAQTVTMQLVPASTRRRSVHSSAHSENASSTTLQPMQTLKMPVHGDSGYARITAAAGSIAAAARITITHPPVAGRFGSAVPVLPEGAALGSGQSKRFAGVDDASPRSVSARTPSTAQSSLTLVETAGQGVTVRVTLRYAFSGGTLVTTNANAARDFAVGAHQTLHIEDLGRSIIGPQRNSYGDLRNMQVDVAVVDGSGRVLAFLTSVDNSSGDLMVRAE